MREKYPGHIQGGVAQADDDDVFAAAEIGRERGVPGQAVAPGDRLVGRVDALHRRLARDAQQSVAGGAVSEDNGVVVAQERRQRHLDAIRAAVAASADRHIADEGEVRRAGDLLELDLALL